MFVTESYWVLAHSGSTSNFQSQKLRTLFIKESVTSISCSDTLNHYEFSAKLILQKFKCILIKIIPRTL